ncbi:MAG: ribonuclease E/G [Pseudomonadota bacterium]
MSDGLIVDPGPFAWVFGRTCRGDLHAVRVVDLVDGMEEALFVCRLTRVVPELGGAFVDIGTEADAFVRLSRRERRGGLAEGARWLVQGVRDPSGDKPGRATRGWRVPGHHLNVVGEGGPSGVAEEVAGAERRQLRERAECLFPEGGICLRARAATADDTGLQREASLLRAARDRWQGDAATRAAPGPVTTLTDRVAATLVALDVSPSSAIVAPWPLRLAVAETLRRAWGLADQPSVEGAADPWTAAGCAEAWAAAHGPEVALAGGGRLTIEPTRALVAVDVDRRGAEAGAAELNRQAMDQLARAITVRQLGGQIVVDFLDPGGKAGQAALRADLDARLDGTGVEVVAVLASGLVVLERARRSTALHERSEPLRDTADAAVRQLADHPGSTVALASDLAAWLDRANVAAAADRWLATVGVVRRFVRDPALPATTFEIR